MFRRWNRARVALAVVLLAAAWHSVSNAHHAVVRINLEELTVAADRIFIGRCTAIEESQEAMAGGVLPVTRYTFAVERSIKGKVSRQLVIKHVGHAAKRATGKTKGITSHGYQVSPDVFLHGMNAYRVGERVLLFLNKDAEDTKATSPVGLYQGAFFISNMPSGKELIRNSINNLGLFSAPYTGIAVKPAGARVIFPGGDQPIAQASGLSPQSAALASKRGELPLDAVVELVERIVSAHGGERGSIVEGGKGALRQ